MRFFTCICVFLLSCSTPSTTTDGGSTCSTSLEKQTSPPSMPPYAGTVYVEPNLITSGDPTSFRSLTASGRGMRRLFDRRVNDWVTVDAWLFDAQFGSSKHVEVQVNPEFSQTQAEQHARQHATILGRLPGFAFRDIDMLWIHGGQQLYGGGNRSILVHTEQTAAYDADGWTEEALLHESGHTSLDGDHADAPRWIEAQKADGVAISTYARDNLAREDVAETLSVWFALRFRGDRLSSEDQDKIKTAIPNRLAYFDCIGVTDALLP